MDRLSEEALELERALVSMDRLASERLVARAFETEGGAALADRLIEPALRSIGDKWETGQYSLSQVYMSGRICEKLVDQLPIQMSLQRPGAPRMAMAVFQDHHVLGKRIVLALLRSAGYTILDYGVGLHTAQLIEKVMADRIDVLMLSVLMIRSALAVQEVVQALADLGLSTRVVVGGAPFRFDPALAEKVGAHAWGTSASDALRIAAELTRTSTAGGSR